MTSKFTAKADSGSPTLDRFRAIAVLFLRLLQRDSIEAPMVMVSPGKGALWVAGVFLGAPPPELMAHYLRSPTPAREGGTHFPVVSTYG